MLYVINVPAGCWNGTNIEQESCLPHEKELLIPPYSVYTVLKVERDSTHGSHKFRKIVYLDLARDNRAKADIWSLKPEKLLKVDF